MTMKTAFPPRSTPSHAFARNCGAGRRGAREYTEGLACGGISPSRGGPAPPPPIGIDLPGRGRPPHFPAFAGTGEEENAGIMAEPIASLEDKEFPKNSINTDKLTGFFDKFLKIKFLGFDAAESGRRGILPRSAGPAMTANAGSCGDGIPPDSRILRAAGIRNRRNRR